MQLNEYIKDNKIYAITGNSGSGKSSLISDIKIDKKIGIVNNDTAKCNLVIDQIEYYDKKYEFKIKELEDRKNEIIKMLEIDKNILNKSIYEISESEYTKVLICSVLLYNPSVIIIDELIDSLDHKNKEKVFKLFIKLKRFFNKKIIVITSNIDDIYEFIDNVIVLDEGNIILSGNKYEVYDNIDLLNEKNIHIPNIVKFIKKMKDRGIKIDNVDTINELIKSVYREMR